jgi:hypothetical protein
MASVSRTRTATTSTCINPFIEHSFALAPGAAGPERIAQACTLSAFLFL